MNETALVQKVWNYAHVLRDQGVPYQAYISQISYLLLLKMDDERVGLVASGLIKGESSAIPEDCRWPVLRDLQGALHKNPVNSIAFLCNPRFCTKMGWNQNAPRD
jgi:type I restriction enzyme M protein